MRYLLNCVYVLLIAAISPILLYRRWTTGRYREGWPQKLWGRIEPRNSEAPCVWLHAVSVGEVLQLESIVKGWRERFPNWDIAISTTTQTGMQVAKKTYPDAHLFYCPLDFSWAVRNTLKRLKPSCVVLVELEIWPNLILESDRANIPVLLINGRLSEKSYRGYRRIRPLVSSLMRRLAVVTAQNEEYRDRFHKLGVPKNRLHVAGSIKFDRLSTDRNSPRTLQLRGDFGIKPDAPVLMAGSTGDPEEKVILSTWISLRQQFPQLQLLIAPRHQERFEEVAELIQRAGFHAVRRSKLGEKPRKSMKQIPPVYLLDTLGDLSACWGVADIAFVGGSLNQRGGQNMMEPAGYGATLLFGPNTWNFAEVVEDLKQARACRVVSNQHEMATQIGELLRTPQTAQRLGRAAQNYVLSKQGATALTLNEIEKTLHLTQPETIRPAA